MPRAVGIPETDAASFTFCQAFDKVLAFRVDADGEPLAPWEWAGVGGFAPIGRESLGDGTQPIPFSAGAVALSDRIFVWGAGEEGGDFGWLSDIASLRFPLTARLRFNAGTDDRIVKGFAFNKDTVIVFKGRSIFRLSGVHGDLSEMVNERVNTRLGPAGAAERGERWGGCAVSFGRRGFPTQRGVGESGGDAAGAGELRDQAADANAHPLDGGGRRGGGGVG
jgi:hypothetical protein